MKGQLQTPKTMSSPRVAQISSAMSMREGREGGFAIVTAISFMAIMGILVSVSLLLAFNNRKQSSDTLRTTQAQMGAEAGLEEAYRQLIINPGFQTNSDSRFVHYFQNFYNTRTFNEASSTVKSLALNSGTAPNRTSGTVVFSGSVGTSQRYSMEVTRREDGNPQQVVLNLKSTGTLVDNAGVALATRVISQTLLITPNIESNDFALLSNNVNCSFCHTRITSMDAAYGGSIVGTQRVKVATLENLEIRYNDTSWDSTDSVVGGTVYTRGNVLKAVGTSNVTISDATNADIIAESNPSFNVYDINSSGKISGSGYKKMSMQDCAATSCTANGNLYKNYATDKNAVDGSVPTAFPPPIRDSDANRIIDGAEWSAEIERERVKAGGYGSISATGGSIQISPMTYSTDGRTTGVAGTLQTATPSHLSGDADGINGNLVIQGDFTIDKTVYVSGDVVISGRVSGKGKIVARGNVYVTGDLEYRCGASTCTSSNYANPASLPTQLGLFTNGNVMIGDYVSQRSAGQADLRNSNRVFTDGDGNSNMSFVMAEVLNFNKTERAKAAANPNYVPRFYRFRTNAGSTDRTKDVRYYTGTGESATNWGHTALIDSALLSRAVVVNLSPTSNWMTEAQIKQLWINNIEGQNATGVFTRQNVTDSLTGRIMRKPLQIDAIVYSGNSTFALARGSTNRYDDNSNKEGLRRLVAGCESDGTSCATTLNHDAVMNMIAFQLQPTVINNFKASAVRQVLGLAATVPVGAVERQRAATFVTQLGSAVDGRVTMNGALISADVGVLASGAGAKKGKMAPASGTPQRNEGYKLHYDSRAKDMLAIEQPASIIRSYTQLVKK